MINVLKDNLLSFSNTVCSIPLDKSTIQRLIYLDSYELQEEYSDIKSYLMQDLLINANEKYTNVILQNLSKAIQTNCGNDIDLESIDIPENFGYRFSINNKEKSINKIYKEYTITPPKPEQFKIIWLKNFVQNLKKIDFTIRKILQLPQKDYSKLKSINIFNLIKDYENFKKEFQQKIENEFQKTASKNEKLNFYFNEMLPDYIEKTDSYFSHFENMRISFKNEFGYLDSEFNSLNAIISKSQINEISNIEKSLNRLDYNDFQSLKNRFLSVIAKIKSNNKLQQKETSNFLKELKNRVENILKNENQPIIESPFSVLEWATIFYYADQTKLLSESSKIKIRMEQFMSKHQINTTFDNFKTKYYEAKKRINEKNDYPINKLELIIPFLKENYKQTVTKVENDIIFLEENKPEY